MELTRPFWRICKEAVEVGGYVDLMLLVFLEIRRVDARSPSPVIGVAAVKFVDTSLLSLTMRFSAAY